MITYVNSKDAKLFELAAADLGVASLDIDQYLNSLAELKAISPKYVRLPLYEDGHEDEEIFEIDANARTIKVPASFSKNGVGVVSDELAETVWFKINRYFDIKDFGKAAGVVGEELKDGNLHILIQWEAPDGAQGASWAYAIDADTDPEYVYFGWALTAEHLTAKPGNIRFAIRIMQYDTAGDIAYSFATQTAAVAVKASLSFDLTDEGVEFESVADKISSRLMGGQIAYCPVFAPVSQELPNGGDLPPYILNLVAPDPVPENDPYNGAARAVLEVVASAPEGTEYDAMAYKWYQKGFNDEDFHQIEGAYTPALTVTSSGEYYVVVFGMIEIVDNNEYIYDSATGTAAEGKFKYHSSVASTKSMVCEIPVPEALKITEEMAEALILGDDAALTLVIERQKIDGTVVGDVTLKIEKTASAEKDLDLESAEFTVVGAPSEGREAVTEAWIYEGVEYASEAEAKSALELAHPQPEGIDYDYSAIEHREAQEAVPASGGVSYLVDDGAIAIDMSQAEEGYYKVTVINTLNGDHKDTESIVICRVVKPAEVNGAVAVLLTAGGAVSDASEGSVSRENKIRADVTINGLSDERIIQWYKVVDEQDPNPSGDAENDIKIEGANAEIYEPDDDGFFYFMAINKVEGTEDSKRSNIIKFAL